MVILREAVLICSLCLYDYVARFGVQRRSFSFILDSIGIPIYIQRSLTRNFSHAHTLRESSHILLKRILSQG